MPTEDEAETLRFIIINDKEKRVVLEEDQPFKSILSKGFVGNVQGSANNRFLYLQVITPHKIKPGYFDLVISY